MSVPKRWLATRPCQPQQAHDGALTTPQDDLHRDLHGGRGLAGGLAITVKVKPDLPITV